MPRFTIVKVCPACKAEWEGTTEELHAQTVKDEENEYLCCLECGYQYRV